MAKTQRKQRKPKTFQWTENTAQLFRNEPTNDIAKSLGVTPQNVYSRRNFIAKKFGGDMKKTTKLANEWLEAHGKGIATPNGETVSMEIPNLPKKAKPTVTNTKRNAAQRPGFHGSKRSAADEEEIPEGVFMEFQGASFMFPRGTKVRFEGENVISFIQ